MFKGGRVRRGVFVDFGDEVMKVGGYDGGG